MKEYNLNTVLITVQSYNHNLLVLGGPGSLSSKAPGYGLEGSGMLSGDEGVEIFLRSVSKLDLKPTSFVYSEYRSLSPRVKADECRINHRTSS